MSRVTPRLSLDPSIDAYAAWPYPESTLYFFSGSNSPVEIAVLAERGLNIGVAVPDLSGPAISALLGLAPSHSRVFVDSGAFSEVEFSSRGPIWPHPISPSEWQRRLGIYYQIASAHHNHAFLVAPDQVANQIGTLERLVAYAPIIAHCAAQGAFILVPIQKGSISMTDFWYEEMRALDAVGVPRERYYPAIPLKKDATSLAELQQFTYAVACQDYPRPRMHFLGRGVYSPDYRDTFAAVMAVCPHLVITSDSVHARSSGFAGSKQHPGPYLLAKRTLQAMGVPPSAAVRAGYHMALDQEDLGQLIDALHAGWYDSELFSSSQEQLAWMSAGSPEPDRWEPIWAELRRRMR